MLPTRFLPFLAVLALLPLACSSPRRGCERDRDCDEGSCLDGECRTEQCATDGDCGGTERCASGACVTSCAAGTADCNGVASDLCEISMTDDPAHCGRCANVCATGYCRASACATPPAIDVQVCVGENESTLRCHAAGAVGALTFGTAEVGASTTRLLRIRQLGVEVAHVQALRLSGSADFSLGDLGLPASIPGAGHLDVALRFAPTAVGPRDAVLTVDSDDPAEPSLLLTLSGSGLDGCAPRFTMASIAFGETAAQGRRDATATLANEGTQPCAIEQVPAVSIGADVRFRLLNPPAVPRVLQAGASLALDVAYEPVDANGPDEGELTARYKGADGTARSLTIALRGTPTRPLTCTLAVTPGSAPGSAFQLGFGTVPVASERTRTITLENVGAANCTLANPRIVRIAAADASAYRLRVPPPAVLAPGATSDVVIAFAPLSEGTFGAPTPQAPTIAFFLDTNDVARFGAGRCTMAGNPTGPSGCVSWALSARAVVEPVVFTPAALDFGTTQLGCRSGEKRVGMAVVRSTPVTVKSLSISPANTGISYNTQALPTTISAGGQLELFLRHQPLTAGTTTAELRIGTNVSDGAGGERTFTIALTARAAATSAVTDSWTQAPSPLVDVLFIVDDSGSMSEEQAALANNVPVFVNAANAAGADFHFGVITTDVEAGNASRGILRGTPKIVKPGPQAAAELANNIRVGTGGSGKEQGLDALLLALTLPNEVDPRKNGGFLRPDARLAVVVLSDEEDYSPLPPSFYAGLLDVIKGQGTSGLTALSAIVAPAGGCTWSGGSADDGSRYRAVQTATGGRFRSICANDWGLIANDLAGDIFILRSHFPLSSAAASGPITVRVNGLPAPASQWSYVADSNSIVFVTASIPPAGSSISVGYESACR